MLKIGSFIKLFCCLVFPLTIVAQTSSEQIVISDIQEFVTKNWLGVPSKVDYALYWDVYNAETEQFEKTDFNQYEQFSIQFFEKNNPDESALIQNIENNFYTITGKKTGKKYGILINGLMKNGAFVTSDTAWILTGRNLHAAAGSENKQSFVWHHWIPFNGRIPLAVIKRQHFFDLSTNSGKVAFHMIWNFLLFGVFIWFFYCIRYLSLGNIFPYEKGISFLYSYDEQYRKRESKEFRKILADWQEIVKAANDNVRREINTSEQIQVNEIEGANVKFWRDKGTKAICELLERVSKPGMNRYPAARIIQAGLETHELGGYHWTEVSKEVDRAIENRASSEMENLKRRSLLDWLWNLGSLAPLIGLFGTATGISHAFATLTFLQADISQTELVKQLAGGIYEALWTTIEGLFVGIFLMILYYFYQNKLNWIYSKWEDIYVHITEKL